MPGTPKLRQLSNSQTQAGAAAQLIVNIFIVSAGDKAWIVKPIAFHVDGATSPDGEPLPDGESQTCVDIDADAGRRGNAQGQGLTVINDTSLLEVLGQAIRTAAHDQDIQQALRQGR